MGKHERANGERAEKVVTADEKVLSNRLDPLESKLPEGIGIIPSYRLQKLKSWLTKAQ